MYMNEQTFISEEEALNFISEAFSSSPNTFRTDIIDPIINKLEKNDVRKHYIEYGDTFLSANADMLAKEYPTKAVSFPKKYIDDIFELFGFTQTEIKKTLKECLRTINETSSWNHILASPTNVIHVIVMYYSDMGQYRLLRDSARQQLALTNWARMYQKYWPAVLNEAVMAYTYASLNNTWNIVRSENMISWISEMTETGYSFYRAKLDLNMNIKTVVDLLNRIRNVFNQATQLLANKYTENAVAGSMAGKDTDGTEEYVDTNSYISIRNGLMLLIKNGDKKYWSKGDLYKGTARLKNIDDDDLFDFATKKVKFSDISKTMDLIFYVFLSKEGNHINDINSYKFINRITNFPTAIDRAIQGSPYIQPMMKKYGESQEVIRAFVCLIAIYILNRINDVKE